MPTANGNAAGEQNLTDALTPNEEQPGTSDPGQDLTEVVKGLSRTVSTLKKQLAEAVAKPADDTVVKENAALKRENTRYQTLQKYPDIAPVLDKLMAKENFDYSVLDEEFISAIRSAAGKPAGATETEVVEQTVYTPAIGPARRTNLTQDQQDEANLKNLDSIWSLR